MAASLASAQTFSFSQLGSPLVKGPEAVYSKFQSSRHMKRIKGTHMKRRYVPARQAFTGGESAPWLICENPDAAGAVLLEGSDH
jgi:hypothetical protein